MLTWLVRTITQKRPQRLHEPYVVALGDTETAKGVTLMGRGRQKAKATRQARDMKYFSPATDLAALGESYPERNPIGTRSTSTPNTRKNMISMTMGTTRTHRIRRTASRRVSLTLERSAW